MSCGRWLTITTTLGVSFACRLVRITSLLSLFIYMSFLLLGILTCRLNRLDVTDLKMYYVLKDELFLENSYIIVRV